ncbi:MAG: hypothetical protein GY943_00865, partial [Chloroflexi bacterium]|nr:hypothetical protein [Chloroflexota bacterium]
GFLNYFEEGHRHYHKAMSGLVNRDFRTVSEFFALKNLPLLHQVKPLAKHCRHMAQFFESPRLKAAFTFQDVYMGLNPFEAPATFSMMPYTELAHGVWYPKGGMYNIVEAMVDVAQAVGVEIVLNMAVEQDWPAIRERARQEIFRRLETIGVTDLEAHIKFEMNCIPLSWRKRYNLVKGATHGLCHNLMQLGYMRPRNRHPNYHNLYFVGASTHPGTGVPTAMVSGRLSAARVMDDLG